MLLTVDVPRLGVSRILASASARSWMRMAALAGRRRRHDCATAWQCPRRRGPLPFPHTAPDTNGPSSSRSRITRSLPPSTASQLASRAPLGGVGEVRSIARCTVAIIAMAVFAGCGPAPTATVTSGPVSVHSTPPRSVLDISYGDGPNQVGDLRLPGGSGLAPVVVLIHGGFWREPFKRDLMEGLALDLTRRGFATWNLEYRRVGASGGGWPQTATDVARGIDHLAALASTYPLDLSRVALVGHSAGGHLALWAGARQRLPEGGPGAHPQVKPTYVVSLAGVADLEEADRTGLGGGAVASFLGPGRDRAAVYSEASPRALLPLGVPQLLVHGTADRIVPLTQSESYATAAGIAGDEVEFLPMPEADHFDLIEPSTAAWAATAARLIDRLAPHPR